VYTAIFIEFPSVEVIRLVVPVVQVVLLRVPTKSKHHQ